MAFKSPFTQQMLNEAAQKARDEVLKTAKKKGVTLCRAMHRLKESLDAKETKVFLNKNTGVLVYSKPLIAHNIRLKAVEVALAIHDAIPKRLELTGKNGGPIAMTLTERLKQLTEQDGSPSSE